VIRGNGQRLGAANRVDTRHGVVGRGSGGTIRKGHPITVPCEIDGDPATQAARRPRNEGDALRIGHDGDASPS